MLDFLVLGRLPGTQVQYNFNDVLLALAWTLVILEAGLLIHRYRSGSKATAHGKPIKSASSTTLKKHAKKQTNASVKMTPKSATQ